MMQFRGGGWWTNCVRLSHPVGKTVVLPPNPRRFLLSAYVRATTSFQLSVDAWRNIAAPTNGTEAFTGALLFSGVSNEGVRFDYRYFGGMIQSQIVLETLAGTTNIDIMEVSCDCPFSDQFGPTITTFPTYPKYTIAGISFPNTTIPVLPSNEARVALYVFPIGGATYITKFGSGTDQASVIRNVAGFNAYPITYGDVGDLISSSVAFTIPSGSAQFQLVEIMRG